VRLPRFGEPVSSVVWAPDGQTFITGCLDKEKNLCQWNIRGELTYDWGRAHRIQDLAVSANGHFLVAMECETHIYVYNFVTRELEYELDLKTKLASVSISQNSKYLLAHNVAGEARMIDLDTRETVRMFKSGEKAGLFVIKAAYGGANESFVVIGSEGMFCDLGIVIITDLVRWSCFHLAQGNWSADREARSPQGVLQRNSVESHKSVHVRLRRR